MVTKVQNEMLEEPMPGTTKGDLIAHDGSVHIRKPIGSDDKVLTAKASAAGGISWEDPPAAAAVGVGSVIAFAGSSIPTGYLACNGAAVSRTTYADLFAAIGTTYGVGDGSTTFNLPNLAGRTIVGDCDAAGEEVLTISAVDDPDDNVAVNSSELTTGIKVLYEASGTPITGLTDDTEYYLIRESATEFGLALDREDAMEGTKIAISGTPPSGTHTLTYQLTDRNRGDTGGEEEHTVSLAEMPEHDHNALTGTTTTGAGSNTVGGSTEAFEQGAWEPHQNMPPWLALHWLIYFGTTS